MLRFLLAAFAAATLFSGSLLADEKDRETSKHNLVTITKIDAKKGEITVRYTDEKGKEQEKTFELNSEVKLLDETGRVVAIDFFQSGNEALILAAEGKLREVRRHAHAQRGQRLSDAVKTLIEMTDGEEAYVEEVQRIYDMLRKLDPEKTGKIDAKQLKAERERILEERIKGVFKRLDTNGDGFISKEEAKGGIKEHFDSIDRNKDGLIDLEELLQAAREKHEKKPTQPEKK